MRGQSVTQLNEQFFFFIFESKVTALLQSARHWIFFVQLHCSISPMKLPPVACANFPIWCYLKDWEAGAGEKSGGEGTREMRKALQNLDGNSTSVDTL